MSDIIPFDFEEQAVRVVMRDGEPWFVAADVCRVLRIENPSQAVARLDADERAMLNIGRQGETNIISESGLYTLILRSRQATTPGTVQHRFRKWVTAEVLPSIRKTGKYASAVTHKPHMAAFIQRRRRELALSVDDLARSCGRTTGHIQSLEAGRYRNPTLDTLIGLADVLKCSLDNLAGFQPAMPDLVAIREGDAKLAHTDNVPEARILHLAKEIAKDLDAMPGGDWHVRIHPKTAGDSQVTILNAAALLPSR